MAFIKKLISAAVCLSLTAALLVPVSASGQITMGQEQPVSITDTNGISGSFFSFVPEEDGFYRYYSYNCGTGDPYGFITDNRHNTIASGNDVDSSNRNFEMVCHMYAGDLYYLAATAYAGSANYRIKIEKLPNPASIRFREDAVTGQMSQSKQLQLTVQPATCGGYGITFRSSAPEIVQVDEDGCVYFLRPGTATVTASTWNGLTAVCTVTTATPEAIGLNTGVTLNAALGTQYLSFTAPATGWYGAASAGNAIDPYLSVLDEGLNEIAWDDDDLDGRNFFAPFYLQAGQKCYLAIEHYDSVGLGTLTVSKLAAPTAITLKEERLVGYPGTYCQLTPLYTPLASIPESLSWTSSNEAVASVDEYGYVILRAVGSATVKFTSASGKTGSITVTVQAAPTGSSLVASGICGADLRWQLDETGKLTLVGTGDMFDNYRGWEAYANRISQVDLPQGITSIGSNAFAGCENLTQIDLPSGLRHIGYDAFRGCGALKQINLPNGLSHLGQGAFAGCSGLTQVDIPSGLTQVPMDSFAQCSALSKVTLPTGLVSIQDRAFDGCPLQPTVSIPSTVAYLGNDLFRGSRVTCLRFTGDAPTFGATALSGLNGTAFYPIDNSTWTAAIRQNYGGTVSWTGEATLTGSVTVFRNAAATVTLRSANSDTPLQTGTAQNGSYTFPNVPSGSYTLTVSAPNHITRSVTFQLTGSTGPDMTVHLLGDINGDGRINVGDVARVYGHARRTAFLTDEYAFACGDVLTDGRITVGDTARIYAHAKKTSSLF